MYGMDHTSTNRNCLKFFLIAASLLLAGGTAAGIEDPVRYADPFVGTDNTKGVSNGNL